MSAGCDRELYISGAIDGDEGPWSVVAECNGQPCCDFRILIAGSESWGITAPEVAELAAMHREGRL